MNGMKEEIYRMVQHGKIEKLDRLEEIDAAYKELIESMDEEELSGSYLNDDNTSFRVKDTKDAVKGFRAEISTSEIRALEDYGRFLSEKPKKAEKLAYIEAHPEAHWEAVEGTAPYGKGKINARIKAIRDSWTFPENSLESRLVRAAELLEEEKAVKAEQKEKAAALLQKTMDTIRSLSDEEAKDLLRRKWIEPLTAKLLSLPVNAHRRLSEQVEALTEKYAETAQEIEEKNTAARRALTAMMSELTGSVYDEKGLAVWKALFTED